MSKAMRKYKWESKPLVTLVVVWGGGSRKHQEVMLRTPDGPWWMLSESFPTKAKVMAEMRRIKALIDGDKQFERACGELVRRITKKDPK